MAVRFVKRNIPWIMRKCCTMATATEEHWAKETKGAVYERIRPFSPHINTQNCVARHGAFYEDDNTMRVMRMSMQTVNETRAAGRSGVNSLWSPALIGRAIMLCQLCYKYSLHARLSRKDDGTGVLPFCSLEGTNACMNIFCGTTITILGVFF